MLSEKLESGKWFLKSKVAQRMFLMFVLSAILPLLTIAAMSYFYVGHQLTVLTEKRLQQQCRYFGLQIYERLTAMEDYLALVAQKLRQDGKFGHEPFDPIKRAGHGIRRIFVLSDGRLTPICDHLKDYPYPAFSRAIQIENDQTILKIVSSGQDNPSIYMLKRIAPDRPELGTIAGEIDPVYLWGIGANGALPPEIDMTVIAADGKKLISSTLDFQVDEPFLKVKQKEPFSGIYENTFGAKAYINIYWSLFLNHRFFIPDWTIILSQSKASIMAPVSKFKHTFFLLVLLTFWIILLISFNTIRRRTTPIETLKAGAMKIAHGEYGYKVDISSGDEFESLAETFNEMSDKINKSQAMLLQSAKMSTFGQMSAGIVHEIGQPLSAISGYAELMNMGGLSEEKQQHYFAIISQQIERLKTIISKFRIFSRSSHQVVAEVDLNYILHQTRNLLEYQLKIKMVEVQWSIDRALPPILGDADGLQQVFLNLLSNAVDALEKSKGTPTIEIKTYANDGSVHVEIADNGCGISKEIQQSVFDPFFTTKGEEKGTGLGLAITSSIVQKHNGTIQLISDADKGTTFILRFPIYERNEL